MSTRIHFSTLVLLTAVSFLSACGAETDPRSEPPLVRTATSGAATGSSREFTGVVAARVQSDLGFRVGGKIVQRLVDPGQVVRRGQALMRIDGTDFALNTKALQENVGAAQARAQQTAAEERRYRNLLGAGAVSASAYDQAKAAADVARAQLAAAQAQARASGNETSYAVLVADSDGIVIETLAEPGQVVSAGQIVLRLARSGPREALVHLPETVRPALNSNARARTFEGATSTATLRELSEAADPASRTFAARYVLSGAAASAPIGSTVTVELATPGDAAATEIPLGALHDNGRGPGVWIILPGKRPTVAWQPVTLSAVSEETAQVTSGLKPGQRFVALGAHMLKQGQPVRLARTAGATQ